MEVRADIDHLRELFGEPNPEYDLYDDDERHSALWRIPKKMLLYYSGNEYDHFDMPEGGDDSDTYRLVTKDLEWMKKYVEKKGFALALEPGLHSEHMLFTLTRQ